MKVFVDTNIFLDLILKRENFKEALLIFNSIEKKIFSGVVLDITILNIDYIAKKQIKDIRDFLKLVNQHFLVTGATNSMIQSAIEIENKDLEDNLQYLSAKKQNCDLIITNDKDFISLEVQSITSIEFVDKYL